MRMLDFDSVECVWFPGSTQHPPMIWGIVRRGTAYVLIKSYDSGNTLEVAGKFSTRKDARAYVYDWMEDSLE